MITHRRAPTGAGRRPPSVGHYLNPDRPSRTLCGRVFDDIEPREAPLSTKGDCLVCIGVAARRAQQ